MGTAVGASGQGSKPENGCRGTVLTLVESGFDKIPAARRSEAYRMHEEGWAAQRKSIEQYPARAA
ncbi:MAG TPA: hypothetical protein DD658_10395 [Deltaproteobacteria bacterium]|nr:hypothetical protein [Deltaproteobacteria bacterium]